jgi:hypothetical protein
VTSCPRPLGREADLGSKAVAGSATIDDSFGRQVWDLRDNNIWIVLVAQRIARLTNYLGNLLVTR